MSTIRGEKKGGKDGDCHLPERLCTTFQRRFRVPPSVETEKIDANFAKSVLTVAADDEAATVAFRDALGSDLVIFGDDDRCLVGHPSRHH